MSIIRSNNKIKPILTKEYTTYNPFIIQIIGSEVGYTKVIVRIKILSLENFYSYGADISTNSSFKNCTTIYASYSNVDGYRSIIIPNLVPGTKYYVRAFIFTNEYTKYTDSVEITTLTAPSTPNGIPALATKIITPSTSSATLRFDTNSSSYSPSEAFYIDWGDGNTTTISANTKMTNQTHTYSTTGIYTIYMWSASTTDTTFGKMPPFKANSSNMTISRIETPLQKWYSKTTRKYTDSSLNFRGCTSLTYVCNNLFEALSDSETPTNSMFENIFRSCTNLEESPSFLQWVNTSPDNRIFFYAFNGDSKLKKITIGYNGPYSGNNTSYWVQNVKATGDMYAPKYASIPVGTGGIPSGWTRHDV